MKCIRCDTYECQHTQTQRIAFWQSVNLTCVNCGRKGSEIGTGGIEKECACFDAHPITLDVPHAPLCWDCFNKNGGVCWSCELDINHKPKLLLDEINGAETPWPQQPPPHHEGLFDGEGTPWDEEQDNEDLI